MIPNFSAPDPAPRRVVDAGPASDMAIAIENFLHVLDDGYFGDLRIGPSYDLAESAFISGLRETVASYRVAEAIAADRALTRAARERSAEIAQAMDAA